jgi:hypothetical protein
VRPRVWIIVGHADKRMKGSGSKHGTLLVMVACNMPTKSGAWLSHLLIPAERIPDCHAM